MIRKFFVFSSSTNSRGHKLNEMFNCMKTSLKRVGAAHTHVQVSFGSMTQIPSFFPQKSKPAKLKTFTKSWKIFRAERFWETNNKSKKGQLWIERFVALITMVHVYIQNHLTFHLATLYCTTEFFGCTNVQVFFLSFCWQPINRCRSISFKIFLFSVSKNEVEP